MREMPALPIESAGILLVGIVPNPYMTEKGRDERICRIPFDNALQAVPVQQVCNSSIPKNNLCFLIDFNFIYVILNIIKANEKGELIWR